MRIGRVLVNANSSYVSIDLSDLARLGLILKSIEIVDDSRLQWTNQTEAWCIPRFTTPSSTS